MLISSLFLKNSHENYYNDQTNIHEHYNYKYKYKNSNLSRYMFYVSIIFFILELILFYYALIITIKCSKNRHEFIIRLILSIIFTTPFVFFNLLSNTCAIEIIQKL